MVICLGHVAVSFSPVTVSLKLLFQQVCFVHGHLPQETNCWFMLSHAIQECLIGEASVTIMIILYFVTLLIQNPSQTWFDSNVSSDVCVHYRCLKHFLMKWSTYIEIITFQALVRFWGYHIVIQNPLRHVSIFNTGLILLICAWECQGHLFMTPKMHAAHMGSLAITSLLGKMP